MTDVSRGLLGPANPESLELERTRTYTEAIYRGTVSMKLRSARIKDFKRFVDLTIRNLPRDTKLVVLLGPNGCGKSSLFDAFQRRLKVDQFYGMSAEFVRYYRRATQDALQATDDVAMEFYDRNPATPDEFKKSLYVRSAYRHDPTFQRATLEQQADILDRHAVRRLLDTDQTVQNNYQRIIWRLLSRVTRPGLRPLAKIN